MGGLLALLGGAIAVGSVWLPWFMLASEPFNPDYWGQPIDMTDAGELANGNYLIVAGAVAAACGLLLVLRLGRSSLRLLLALGAIGGAVAVGAIEFRAYQKLSDAVNAWGGAPAIGWGMYVGAAGAAIAALGGVLALLSQPGRAGATASPKMLLRLVGLAAIAALVGGVILGWPQISKQLGIAQASPSAGSAATPTASPEISEEPSGEPSESPTEEPTEELTAEPSPTASFWTDGHPTPEEALEQFVTDQGYIYGGPCDTAPLAVDYCSAFISTVTEGRIYALGGPASEAEVWVLVRQIDGSWYVVDLASAADGSPAPWGD